MLTDPDFISQLEMLSLLTKRVLGGSLKADRASDKKGSGIKFADYSEYKFGDDYRSIDWKVYGRLETLIIKMFEIEEDVSINIFLDTSPSMMAKLDYAKKISAALGYIALKNMDRLAIFGVNDQLEVIQQPCHGKVNIFPMLRALEALEPGGEDTNLFDCLQEFYHRKPRKGVSVFISDFFIKSGYQKALDQLKWFKHDVYCIQIQDSKEISCDWKGDVTLQCIESNATKKITISPIEAKKYQKAVEKWNADFLTYCAKHEIGCCYTLTDQPFESVIQLILRQGGLVS